MQIFTGMILPKRIIKSLSSNSNFNALVSKTQLPENNPAVSFSTPRHPKEPEISSREIRENERAREEARRVRHSSVSPNISRRNIGGYSGTSFINPSSYFHPLNAPIAIRPRVDIQTAPIQQLRRASTDTPVTSAVTDPPSKITDRHGKTAVHHTSTRSSDDGNESLDEDDPRNFHRSLKRQPVPAPPHLQRREDLPGYTSNHRESQSNHETVIDNGRDTDVSRKTNNDGIKPIQRSFTAPISSPKYPSRYATSKYGTSGKRTSATSSPNSFHHKDREDNYRFENARDEYYQRNPFNIVPFPRQYPIYMYEEFKTSMTEHISPERDLIRSELFEASKSVFNFLSRIDNPRKTQEFNTLRKYFRAKRDNNERIYKISNEEIARLLKVTKFESDEFEDPDAVDFDVQIYAITERQMEYESDKIKYEGD